MTILLAIGLGFPNCDDCKCDPVEGEYFDVQGISRLVNYKKRGTCCADALKEGDAIKLSQYSGLSINLDVNYISNNMKHQCKWDFSLINEALACECVYNGWLGSKEEKLDDLTIITLNDFDAEHMANDTINDLMTISKYPDILDLNDFLSQDTALLDYESISVKLKKAPAANKEFKVKVIITLSTGEIYDAESTPIIFED